MSNKTTIFDEIPGVIEKTQGNRKYLFGTISSDKIKDVTFVPVIEPSRKTYLNENLEKGYQRPGSDSRMRKFSRFSRKIQQCSTTGTSLRARKLEIYARRTRTRFRKNYNPWQSSIVDGQHRLGGFVHLYETEGDIRDVSFILLPHLSVEAEKKSLWVVNSTQKGVPKALTVHLDDENDDAKIGWASISCQIVLSREELPEPECNANIFLLSQCSKTD